MRIKGVELILSDDGKVVAGLIYAGSGSRRVYPYMRYNDLGGATNISGLITPKELRAGLRRGTYMWA
jgi:hypothetical protein